MVTVDAIGNVCPLPVIKAKKMLREESNIIVLVDNEIATQNLQKMAKQLHYQSKVEKIDSHTYKVFIYAHEKIDSNIFYEFPLLATHQAIENYIVVIDKSVMGHGNQELGHLLLKGFIYALTEQDVLPTHVLFYNGGAELTTAGSPALEDLRNLADTGVEVLTCGACLDYLGLKEKFCVGEVTNMYHIVELMSQFHVVRP